MTAFVIAISKIGKPILYRSRVPSFDEMVTCWLPDWGHFELFTSKKDAEDEIKDLISSFNKGNGLFLTDEPCYVGKVRDKETYTYNNASIMSVLLEWTPIGKMIEADFQLTIARVHLEMVQRFTPKVNVTRREPPPKVIPPPKRQFSSQNYVHEDERMILIEYVCDFADRRESAVFKFPLKYHGRDEVLKVDGKLFTESELTPVEFVTHLQNQLALLK